MRFIRNPHVRYILIADIVITALVACLFYILTKLEGTNKPVFFIVLAAMLLMIIVFLISSYLHYKNIADFNAKIEKNLHGSRDLQFDDFLEGDLSVLEDTVGDMVTAHFHQEDMLKEDKVVLAQALADISHQIKTPLSAISLTAEQLAKKDIDPTERRLLSHRMLDHVSRINFFVSTLLKISRMDADVVEFRKETFPADEVVELAVEPLAANLELHGVAFEKNVPENVNVEGDRLWLSEAFTNIIKNCMEHTPPGGKITVDVIENPIYTEFKIRDTGIGISPEDLPHIFERYYKGRDSGSNSIGIGLAFTRSVIHSMGGTIKAENHPEGGALFTVRMIKKNL